MRNISIEILPNFYNLLGTMILMVFFSNILNIVAHHLIIVFFILSGKLRKTWRTYIIYDERRNLNGSLNIQLYVSYVPIYILE